MGREITSLSTSVGTMGRVSCIKEKMLREDFLEVKNKRVQIQACVIQIVSAAMAQGRRGWGTG